jgi:hypothetical protein
VKMLLAELLNGWAGERPMFSDHLVGHDANGVDIGGRCGSLAAPTLGSCVRRRQGKLLGVRRGCGLRVAGYSKIRETPMAIKPKNVLRF